MKQLNTAFALAGVLFGSASGIAPVQAATMEPAAIPVHPAQASTARAAGGRVASTAQTQLLARVNQLRAAGIHCPGSGPRAATAALRYANLHATSAFKQASYMAQSGEVSHIGPGGTTLRVRAASSGIRTVSVTEIIYLGSRLDPEAAIQWWLHSPLHCSIMTDGRYTTAGASVVRGNRGTAYVMVLTSTPN